MKHLKFSRLFAAVTFVAILALAGCKQPEESLPDGVAELSAEELIIGKWTDGVAPYTPYEGYDCSYATNKIESSSWGTHEGIVYIKKLTEDSGYLYYQFSENVNGYDADSNTYEIENTKGKWCAVTFKELTATTVKMCDAYKDYTFAESLDEAVSLYTIDNGYFNYIPEYTKIEE